MNDLPRDPFGGEHLDDGPTGDEAAHADEGMSPAMSSLAQDRDQWKAAALRAEARVRELEREVVDLEKSLDLMWRKR